MMTEEQELRADMQRLGALLEVRAEETLRLKTEAAILELGWNRLDIDLHTYTFLLSRRKEVMPIPK